MRSRAHGDSSRTCPIGPDSRRRGSPATIPPIAPRRGSTRRSRATVAGRTRSARSSRRCSTVAACSRSVVPGASSDRHGAGAARRPAGGGARERSRARWVAPGRRPRRARWRGTGRTRRDVPPAGRALRRRRRLHHRLAGREGRHDPRRHARHRDDLPVDGAVVRGDPAPRVRRGRRRHDGPHALPLPHRLAERRLGLAAGRGRHRGGVQGADRGGGGPGGREATRSATGSSGCARRSVRPSASTSRRSSRRRRRGAGCASSQSWPPPRRRAGRVDSCTAPEQHQPAERVR